jgi:hypothetical protein
MNPELLQMIERALLAWPGVNKETRATDISDYDVTIYYVGKRQIGHVHHDGVADIIVRKGVQQELIAAGRAEPHRGGFDGVVSYYIRDEADVPGAIELFRMSYDRAQQRRAAA